MTTTLKPYRGPDHAPGAELDYTLDFSKGLQAGEAVETVTIAAEGVTATLHSNNGRKIVAIVTAAVDAVPGTDATVIFTMTTDSTPPRTYVQTLLLRIAPAYAVQIANNAAKCV